MSDSYLVDVPLLTVLKAREDSLVAQRDQAHRDLETVRQELRNLCLGLAHEIVRAHLRVAGIEL